MDPDLNDTERLRWEKRLVARAIEGDRRAFAELYEAYAPRVFSRILVPRLGDRAAAEDALSETFRVGFERLETFQSKGVSVYFWFSRIAVNKATDMHRVKGTTRRALASFESLLAPLREPSEDASELLEQAVEADRISDLVGRVLERLNPRYRRAIELRFLEEHSRQSCAEALDVKLGTFDVVLLRALRAFRKEWAATAGGEP